MLYEEAKSYVYGLDMISEQTVNSEEYPLRDALGSIRQLTEQSSAITMFRGYEPYGEVFSSSGSGSSSYGFAGEWTDATGLVHLRARYYSPAVGRFVQKDPVHGIDVFPQAFNPYQYAFSKPMRHTDPFGKNPLIAQCLAIIATSAAVDLALPIGDVVGVAACIKLLVAAGVFSGASLWIAHNAPEAVDDVIDECLMTWERIYNLPEAAPSSSKNPEPRIGQIIPSLPDGERPSHVVRLQSQGGGLEESVDLPNVHPITVAQGLAGLLQLKLIIGQKETILREIAFARAERYIRSGPQNNGLYPPGQSFTVGRGIRVDVEILRGVNFTR